jgi:hypothetical protein
MLVPVTEVTLLEALDLPSAKVVGTDVVDEVPCQLVEIRGIPIEEGGGITGLVTVWLDPSRGMLPRRISTVYDPADPNFPKRPELAERLRGVEFTWTTEEFARVPNPAAEEAESWVPVRASCRQLSGRHVIEVKQPEIRKEPPEEWFAVTLTPGTWFMDLDAGERTGRFIGR